MTIEQPMFSGEGLGGGSGPLQWTVLHYADATSYADASAIVSGTPADNGDNIEFTTTTKGSATVNYWFSNPTKIQFDLPAEVVDMATAIGLPAKQLLFRVTPDSTTAKTEAIGVGVGFKDGSNNNMVMSGLRWVTSGAVWTPINSGYTSSNQGTTTGGPPTNAEALAIMSLLGPVDGSANGTQLATTTVVNGAGGAVRFATFNDLGNWDTDTMEMYIIITQWASALAGGVHKFKVEWAIADIDPS